MRGPAGCFARGCQRRVPPDARSLDPASVWSLQSAYNDDSLTRRLRPPGSFAPPIESRRRPPPPPPTPRLWRGPRALLRNGRCTGPAARFSHAPRVARSHSSGGHPPAPDIPAGRLRRRGRGPTRHAAGQRERLPSLGPDRDAPTVIHQHSPAGNARRRGHRRERVVHGRRWGRASGPARVDVSRVGSSTPSHDGIRAQPASPTRAGCSFPLSGTKSDVHGRSGLDPGRRNGCRGNMATAAVVVDLAPRSRSPTFGPDAGPTLGGTLITAEGPTSSWARRRSSWRPAPSPTTRHGQRPSFPALTGSHDPGRCR